MIPRKYLDRGECQELLEQIVSLLGAETVVNEINCKFSSDDVAWFIGEIDSEYELGMFDEEEDED